MTSKKLFFEKFKEAAASVLPIVVIVAVMCLSFVPMQADLMLSFIIGSVMLIVGMGLFTLGSEVSMTPIGTHMGAKLTKSRNLTLILVVSFLLGIAVTVSEPDLTVLADNVPAIDTMALIVTVGVGVGIFLMLSMVRILFKIPLKWLLIGCYGLVFVLAFLTHPDYLSVAFDSGGVTTGPMTVPFIMALGVGVASIRSDANAQEDSFGLVALCSIGPILAVLILSFVYPGAPAGGEAEVAAQIMDTVAIGRSYLHTLPHEVVNVVMALLPIVVFFLIFQAVALHLRRMPFMKIIMGLGVTLVGLVLFLTGANVGFQALGVQLGMKLAGMGPWRFLLIPIAMLMGWYIINAEPAVHVLNKQVEELSAGAISENAMHYALAIAVAAANGLAMLRVLTGVSILWIIVPGYLVALALTLVVPPTFTAIAFDSGGVASGPLTATFMLPFAMGACQQMGGNIMTDAFGLVALVAMMPLITVQIMGLIYVLKTRKAEAVPEFAYADDDVIELWEV
ncbi:MAG: DUF1538 domain-containing protein [Clostridiales bacterium]|nr:DUF1538 domain-containing protein [Clostridiales bacterium]